MQDAIRAATIAYFDRGLPALNVARRTLGLEPLGSLAEHPFRSRKLLLATARAFDFAPLTLPDGVAYVGPQIGEPAWAEPWRSPWKADDPRPLAAVCFSTSFQNHVGVLQRIVDALAALPMRGVVTLGDTIAAEELQAGENVVLVHSAPHNALMKEADLVVTHGGHGTVMRALVHRRPLLVIPHGRDQNDNAIRVTERRAGLALPADATVDAITGALTKLLVDSSYAEGASSLGDQVAAEAEGSPIVSELEALARSGSAAEERLCAA